MRNFDREGFTLIELLIVVTILAILAAIAIANFITMQDRARVASVKSNMHTTQLAVEDYNVTTFGRYPRNVSEFQSHLPRLRDGTRGFVNPFTRDLELPLDEIPGSTGRIGYTSDNLTPGTVANYTIYGFGKEELLELQLGPSIQGGN